MTLLFLFSSSIVVRILELAFGNTLLRDIAICPKFISKRIM